MVEHRRTPGGGVSVPAGWFIVLSVVACIAAAGWLGVMLVQPTSATAESSSSTPRATEQGTDAPAPTSATPTDPDPTPDPEPTASKEPEVTRESTVSVLNNTGIVNLAKAFSGQVAGAGWTVSGTGNWRGQIVSNTVYYPDGLQPQAELLAKDVGIERVLPSIEPMRMDRLTIILSGPQQ